jgi:hypothetical protein
VKSFQFKSAKPGPDYLEGTVEAESSEMAIKAVQEGNEFDPGTYVLISPDGQIPFSIARSAREPTETKEFHSFGWKVRWIGVAIFPMPVFLVLGLCLFFLDFIDRHGWVFPVMMFGSMFFFGFARLIFVVKMLESFVCPRCHRRNDDWREDSNHRIYYNCPRCRIKWEIGYKMDGRSRRTG